jgi:hypothetical protein
MGLLVVGIPVNFLLVKISWHGTELNLLLLQWFGTICLLLWSGNANQNIFFGLSISLNHMMLKETLPGSSELTGRPIGSGVGTFSNA